MTKSQQWKATERELAKAMGGIRTGPRGTNTPDVIHPRWSPECKFGQPRWFSAQLNKDIEQAKRNAGGKKWFIYIREAVTGRRFIVVPYQEFIELLKLEEEKHERQDVSDLCRCGAVRSEGP